MSPTFELILTCCLTTTGIGFALLLVARLRAALVLTRTSRLASLEIRTRLSTQRLNAILIAENAQLISKGIDQGSLFLQAGHRVVSDLTLGILQLIPATRDRAQLIRETHNAISTGLYGAFREINKQIGGNIAESLKKNTKPRRKKAVGVRARARVAGRKNRG